MAGRVSGDGDMAGRDSDVFGSWWFGGCFAVVVVGCAERCVRCGSDGDECAGVGGAAWVV